MNSMTGFGRSETVLDTHGAVVEISAVNRRNLEIGISLPRDWGDLDPEIQPRLREKIHRGRISFSLKIGTAQQAVTGDWDEDAIASTLLGLRELAGRNNVPFEPDPTLLYRIATSQSEGRLPAWRDHKDTLFQAVDGALDRFVAMREKGVQPCRRICCIVSASSPGSRTVSSPESQDRFQLTRKSCSRGCTGRGWIST